MPSEKKPQYSHSIHETSSDQSTSPSVTMTYARQAVTYGDSLYYIRLQPFITMTYARQAAAARSLAPPVWQRVRALCAGGG